MLKQCKMAIKTDLINITLFLSFFTIFLQNTFGFSGLIYFFIDIPIVVMLIKKSKSIGRAVLKKNLFPITILLIFSIIAAGIGALVNQVSLENTIYGFYKYYRGFLFFLCVFVLSNENSENRTKILFETVFVINVLFTLYQIVILKFDQDKLGGLFGTVIGVNQYTNLFFIVISIYCFFHIMVKKNKKKHNFKHLFMLGIMFLIAAMAEIKFYFAEMAVLLILTNIFARKNLNSAIILLSLGIGIIMSYNLLLIFFPEFSNLIKVLNEGGLTTLIELQQHYSTDTDMGRAAVFSFSNRYYLTDNIKQLFGLGIGSITSSSFVNNSFWELNNASHYDFFSTSYLYMEQGIVGLLLYALFYATLLIKAVISFIRKNNIEYSILLILFVSSSVMIFVYNNVLLSQMCFLNFWALAITYRKMLRAQK